MKTMMISHNTRTTAKFFILAVVAAVYGMYMIWKYCEAEQLWSGSGNIPTMIIGFICEAAAAFAVYQIKVLKSQYIEIADGIVTGIGLDQGMLLKARPFRCEISQIQSVGAAVHMGALKCLELRLKNDIPVICHVEDLKEIGMAVSEYVNQFFSNQVA